MPPKKDWRESPSDAEDTALQYSDIAIGYLSRNDRYRTDYRLALRRVQRGMTTPDDATAALVRRWGISFHADPSVAFDPKMAVARPDLSPASVVLAPPPSGIGAVQNLNRKMLGAIRAHIKIGDLLHFILADNEGDEHLWVSGSLDRPLALILPMEGNPFTRLASAERFCRRLLGMAPGPSASRPPPFRRRHLLTLLRALDGQQEGATRKELAAVLIDRDVQHFNAAEWSESRERKRIGRWLAEAIELRDGGYIRLLRGG